MTYLTKEAAQSALALAKMLEPLAAYGLVGSCDTEQAVRQTALSDFTNIMQAAIDAPPPSGEREALRQRLGEALTEVLTDEDAAIEPDWFDDREIDRVIDAILPAMLFSTMTADACKQDSKRYAARRKAIFLTSMRMLVSGPRKTEGEFNAEYDAGCDKNMEGYVTDHRGVWVKDDAMPAAASQLIQDDAQQLEVPRQTTLKDRIGELVDQHGSLRAAARVLMIDVSYLSRLASGEKNNPDDLLLARMGLRCIVSYTRKGHP